MSQSDPVWIILAAWLEEFWSIYDKYVLLSYTIDTSVLQKAVLILSLSEIE